MALPTPEQREAAEALLNRALALDPQATARLAALAGKSIRFECSQPVVDVVLQIGDGTISLLPPGNGKPTCHLSGDLAAYTRLLAADDKAVALVNAGFTLQGESQLLIDLQMILASIDFEWGATGPAYWIGKLTRSTWGWLKESQPAVTRTAQEFILQEARLSPQKEEMAEFTRAVAELEESTDRLLVKLHRLRQRLPESPGGAA